MSKLSKRTTVCFDPELHDALCQKAACSNQSISGIVNDAIRAMLNVPATQAFLWTGFRLSGWNDDGHSVGELILLDTGFRQYDDYHTLGRNRIVHSIAIAGSAIC